MTQVEPSTVDIRTVANRSFFKQTEGAYPCYNAVIRDERAITENDFSVKLYFAVSANQAHRISQALRHVDYQMRSDEAGRFSVDMQGDANVTAGLQVLFKQTQEGLGGARDGAAQPVVSLAMQDALIRKLDGLLLNKDMVKERLDHDTIRAHAPIATLD